MSEWLFVNVNSALFQLLSISWRKQVNFQWDDDVHFLLDQHAELYFYSASSLKQQSAGRHDAPLGHIILIPSQPVFAFSPQCCVLGGKATNTNRSLWFDPTGARTHDLPHSWTWKILLKYDIRDSNINMYVFVNQYIVDAKI